MQQQHNAREAWQAVHFCLAGKIVSFLDLYMEI